MSNKRFCLIAVKIWGLVLSLKYSLRKKRKATISVSILFWVNFTYTVSLISFVIDLFQTATTADAIKKKQSTFIDYYMVHTLTLTPLKELYLYYLINTHMNFIKPELLLPSSCGKTKAPGN